MTINLEHIIAFLGVLIAAGGVAAGYGYVRSSLRSAHHRIGEMSRMLEDLEERFNQRVIEARIEIVAAEGRVNAHHIVERGRLDIHIRESGEIRERLVRIETLLETLVNGKGE